MAVESVAADHADLRLNGALTLSSWVYVADTDPYSTFSGRIAFKCRGSELYTNASYAIGQKPSGGVGHIWHAFGGYVTLNDGSNTVLEAWSDNHP